MGYISDKTMNKITEEIEEGWNDKWRLILEHMRRISEVNNNSLPPIFVLWSAIIVLHSWNISYYYVYCEYMIL